MRRIVISAFAICLALNSFAQKDSTVPKTIKIDTKIDTRSNDHFLIQFGYLNWINKPDSIKTKGFPHAFNVYVMLNFPFKTDPHWSVALGPGVSSDHMYFDKMYPGIKDPTPTLRFTDVSDTVHFKKLKLATAFAELPIELRYRFNPDNDKGSVKLALGVKIGTMLNAHIRAVDQQDKNDNTINDYILKEASSHFFNRTRLSTTARIGIGRLSLFGAYSITPLFREGQGPLIRPLTFGLTLSGL
jgi:hypothetical protein